MSIRRVAVPSCLSPPAHERVLSSRVPTSVPHTALRFTSSGETVKHHRVSLVRSPSVLSYTTRNVRAYPTPATRVVGSEKYEFSRDVPVARTQPRPVPFAGLDSVPASPCRSLEIPLHLLRAVPKALPFFSSLYVYPRRRDLFSLRRKQGSARRFDVSPVLLSFLVPPRRALSSIVYSSTLLETCLFRDCSSMFVTLLVSSSQTRAEELCELRLTGTSGF